jgi:starvation-inducible DNA-binding protein
MIAERMTAIGSAPDGRVATLAATTPLPELLSGAINERSVIAAFDERVTTVASRVRSRAEEVGDGDLATQDLFIEILRGLEKQRWMLRAHLA